MKVLLVGAGGYGGVYLDYLLGCDKSEIEFVGVVEKYFATCPSREKILSANIPVYETLEQFYAENTADLACISTPTFLHTEQSLYCMAHGSNVLCEKPAAPTPQDVEKMIEGEKKYGKFLAIGYQWSYSDAIRNLKKDILDGKLGKPVAMKTFINWPRDKAYYARGGGWGGRISKDGILILDSIAANACAHYIHNMFFVLGDTEETSARPKHVEAACLRANHIENFDTAIIKMTTESGCKLAFYASHAMQPAKNPIFEYEFENATVKFSQSDGSKIIAYSKDGAQIKNYGNPSTFICKKIADCIDCTRAGTRPICTAETALPHTELIYQLYKNAAISEFPAQMKNENDEAVYINGFYDTFKDLYDKNEMISSEEYPFVTVSKFEM